MTIQDHRLRELEYHFKVFFNLMGKLMFLLQSSYFSHILKQFQMEIAKTTSPQMVETIRELSLEPVNMEAEHKEGDQFPCSLVTGVLLYLNTHRRQHITFLVGILSRFSKLRPLHIGWLRRACLVIKMELKKPESRLEPLGTIKNAKWQPYKAVRL